MIVSPLHTAIRTTSGNLVMVSDRPHVAIYRAARREQCQASSSRSEPVFSEPMLHHQTFV